MKIVILSFLAFGCFVPASAFARRGNPNLNSGAASLQFYLIDSDDDHPAKPTYTFLDTTFGTWNRVSGFSDSDTGYASLSPATTISFPYYRQQIILPPRHIFVNGLMIFDEAPTPGSIAETLFHRFRTWPNSALPVNLFSMLCPLWTDLELRTSGDSSKIYYRLTTDSCSISFYNMALRGSNGRIRATFQVTFAQVDSSITICYRSFDGNADGESAASIFQRLATIGVQDTLGRYATNYLDRGTYYAFSRAANPAPYETNLHNGLAVKFRRVSSNYITLKSIAFPPNDGYEVAGSSFQPTVRIEQNTDSNQTVYVLNEIFNTTTGVKVYSRTDSVVVGQFETAFTGPAALIGCGSYRMISTIYSQALGADPWPHDNILTRDFVRLSELTMPYLEDFKQFDRCAYNAKGITYASSAEAVMRDPAAPYASGALVFDRRNARGSYYTDPGAGDTVATSVFNLQGRSNVWLIFSYQRGLPADSIQAGIRSRKLTGPELRRTSSNPALIEGDSLVIEALASSGSTWNPSAAAWIQIGAITGGIDVDTKKFRVQVPSSYLHNHSRFRFRLNAKNNGPLVGAPFDDADPFVIDALQIAAPTSGKETDLEPIGLELGAKYYTHIPRDVKFITPKVRVASNGLQANLAVYQVRLVLWDALGREVYHQMKSLVAPSPRSIVELPMLEFPIEGSQGGIFTARVTIEQMFSDYWRANDTNTFYRKLEIDDAYAYDDGQPDTAGTMTSANHSWYFYTFRPLRTDSLRGMEFFHLTANGSTNWVITFRQGSTVKYTRSLNYDVLTRGFHRAFFNKPVPLSADSTYVIQCDMAQGFALGGDASLGLVIPDADGNHYWPLYPSVLNDFTDNVAAYGSLTSPRNAPGGGPLLPMMRLVYRGSSTYLPVELLSLRAKRIADAVILDFATAAESQTDRFTIERSVGGDVWEHVATIAAANALHGAAYSVTDPNAPNEDLLYRLIAHDLDGSKQVLAAISVGPSRGASATLRTSPNPASGSVRLMLPAIGAAMRGTLYDEAGRIAKTFPIESADPTVELDGLAGGMYMLEVTIDGHRYRTKLVVR